MGVVFLLKTQKANGALCAAEMHAAAAATAAAAAAHVKKLGDIPFLCSAIPSFAHGCNLERTDAATQQQQQQRALSLTLLLLPMKTQQQQQQQQEQEQQQD